MNTIFKKSQEGRSLGIISKAQNEYKISAKFLREKPANLPELAEVDLVRHYTALSKRAYGVDDGFYPLGSCTMKYNPKINEKAASLPGFANIHPLQNEDSVQGALEAMFTLQEYLKEITGMDAVSLQPAAGAHGEYTSLQLIRAYHNDRKDFARKKIIVPDSAHGTNPASAAMVGFEIVNISSAVDGTVDIDALKNALGADTAAFMLTNPNTLGIFDKNILKISKLVHEAGGLLYYDGANLNAVMGKARPKDMGFDVVHLNLHKTFSTPHGGGGPGSGPIGCVDKLKKFLPIPTVEFENGKYRLNHDLGTSIGSIKTFYGNFLVCIRALTYIVSLGAEGIKDASEMAVLNANYLKALLKEKYEMATEGYNMHEFVITLEHMKEKYNVSAMDISKAIIDCGMHPPTMYFPLIVHEALMFEPTETESRETLDGAAEILLAIFDQAVENPEGMHAHPIKTPIGRADEVKAARNPIIIEQE